METTKTFQTSGVCSRYITVTVEDGIVKNVQFMGGCSGNTQGVSALIRGMKVDDAIGRLRGIDCGGRGTSCGDQLAIAIESALKQSE